jgi:hypothetical protein
MFRCWVIGVLCCVLVGVTQAREKLRRMPGGTLPAVAAIDGELRKDEKRASLWLPRTTARGTLIYLKGGELAGAWGGWYLNFDHRGKDARVSLVPEPGPGCYWTWEEGPWRKSRDFGRTFAITVRPANGPMRGWLLTMDGDKLILAKETAAEVKFQGYVDDLDDGK